MHIIVRYFNTYALATSPYRSLTVHIDALLQRIKPPVLCRLCHSQRLNQREESELVVFIFLSSSRTHTTLHLSLASLNNRRRPPCPPHSLYRNRLHKTGRTTKISLLRAIDAPQMKPPPHIRAPYTSPVVHHSVRRRKFHRISLCLPFIREKAKHFSVTHFIFVNGHCVWFAISKAAPLSSCLAR